MLRVDHLISAKSAVLLALTPDRGTAKHIFDRMNAWSGGYMRILKNSVYMAIPSLEADGLIQKCTWQSYYELTPFGREKAMVLWKALQGIVENGFGDVLCRRKAS